MAALAIPPLPTVPPIPSPMMSDIHALKLRFAAMMLRFQDATKAALAIFPDEPGRALQIISSWPVDDIVLAEMDRLIEENGPEAYLPSKQQLLVELKHRLDAAKTCTDYATLMRLYAEMRDLLPKPGAAAEVKVQVQNVLVVPSQGSDEEWEKRAQRSQRLLIDGAATT